MRFFLTCVECNTHIYCGRHSRNLFSKSKKFSRSNLFFSSSIDELYNIVSLPFSLDGCRRIFSFFIHSLCEMRQQNSVLFFRFFFIFSIYLLQLWPQVSFSSTIVMLIDASTVDKGGKKIKEKIKEKKKLVFYF
jgi:hypothetical protein